MLRETDTPGHLTTAHHIIRALVTTPALITVLNVEEGIMVPITGLTGSEHQMVEKVLEKGLLVEGLDDAEYIHAATTRLGNFTLAVLVALAGGPDEPRISVVPGVAKLNPKDGEYNPNIGRRLALYRALTGKTNFKANE
jgi:hypothetical protein